MLPSLFLCVDLSNNSYYKQTNKKIRRDKPVEVCLKGVKNSNEREPIRLTILFCSCIGKISPKIAVKFKRFSYIKNCGY